MTRQIPRQYWRYYSPQQLAERELLSAFTTIRSYGESDLEGLYKYAMKKKEEAEEVEKEFQKICEQVLFESLSTIKSSGLEIILDVDEHGEVPYDELVGYASSPTQQCFREKRREREVCWAIFKHIGTYYNEMRESYQKIHTNI